MSLLVEYKKLREYIKANLEGLDEEYFRELREMEKNPVHYAEDINNLKDLLNAANVADLLSSVDTAISLLEEYEESGQ